MIEYLHKIKSIFIINKSIQTKFLSLTLPVLIVLLFVLGIFIYNDNSNTLKSNINDLSIQIVNSRSDEVSSWLKSMINELSQVAQHAELKSMNWSEIDPVLQDFMKSRESDYGLIFVIYPDGSYYIPSKGKAKANLSERDYFKEVYLNGKDYAIANPSVSKSTGEVKFNVSVPIKNKKGEVVGCLAVNVYLDTFSKIISQIKIGQTGYGYIIDNSGVIIAHPNSDYVMNLNISDSEKNGFKGLQENASEILNNNEGSLDVLTPENNEELMIYSKIDISPQWTLGVAISTDEIFAGIKSFLIKILFLFIGFLVVFSVLMWFISNRMVSTPLKKLINHTSFIADGFLTQDFEYNSKDEVGQTFAALKSMQDKLRVIVKSIIEGSELMKQGSVQISSASDAIASGANQQAASTEQISSSMEEMVSSINQITDHAYHTEKVALDAANKIVEISQASNQSLEAFNEIFEKIKIIGEIAERTDLLAINAAIEAARAGESGKGFAVVANEVRKLAERSQSSAVDINEFSSKSVAITNKSKLLMDDIAPKIQQNADLIREISASSKEQNIGAEQIQQALIQLTNVTQQNSSASEQLAASAAGLTEQASHLNEAISFFKLDNNAASTEIDRLTNEVASLMKKISDKSAKK